MNFPEGFAFYHLGKVEKIAPSGQTEFVEPALAFDKRVGVSFNLYGEETSLIVLLFDQKLDVSTYTEMGNVLASRIASNLCNASGLETMISPPRFLTSEQLQSQISPVLNALEMSGIRIQAQEYAHNHGENSISLQLLVIPGNQEQVLEQRIFS